MKELFGALKEIRDNYRRNFMKVVDLKTIIILSLVVTLELLTLGITVGIFRPELEAFKAIFILFSNVTNVSVTYFFTSREFK